jgi:glycosyltransferase involved in cell wall biosynthesis
VRVAFVSQLPLALDAGGLEIQLRSTAEALRVAGVDVELLDPWKSGFDADVLHCFGSDYQLGEIVARARARGIPVVVSAVFAPRRAPGFYLGWKHLDRLVPVKTSFGTRRAILQAAGAVVALTRTEARYLQRIFGTDPGKTHIIANGVDDRFFRATPDAFAGAHGVRDFVLCVASVEPLKNQVRLVRATAGLGVPLVLIGAARSQEQAYADQLAAEIAARTDVLWVRGLPHDDELLASAFAGARVHVLPSVVEAQGISTLEAAAAGANIVASGLPALREAFAGYAWFCDPSSVPSIRAAVRAAHESPRGCRYVEKPPWLLSWADVARRLQGIYEGVVAGR